MSEATVPEDASALSRADRALFRVEQGFAFLAGVSILIVMLVSVANIIGRKLGETLDDMGLDALADWFGPVPGFVDWMEQAVPLIAFLAVAYCQRLGGHIRMDLLIGALKGRALYVAEWLGTLFILALALILIYGSWLHFERSFDWNAPMYSRDSTIDIGLPLWPVKLLVPVMLAFLSLRLVLQLWAYTVAILQNPATAVAVPRIESAAEQAEHEAETLAEIAPRAESADLAKGARP
ncbi:MAG: TRAP transporter small permease [Pseudomonadota bacterium]